MRNNMHLQIAKMLYTDKLISPFRNIRRYCTSRSINSTDIAKLRNIGILAHIDAGKTTATERMLFYAGVIGQMGEVHHGNTVTDYMAQERERGITITSASVTFNWKQHQFNLIDTPGHIDFTIEVEETLSVLDGAIVVLDGSAGVEAQTLTVWRQANRFKLPRIIFVNKMDRCDSNVDMCSQSIEQQLEVPTICLQLPIVTDGKLQGLVDVLTLEKCMWHSTAAEKSACKTNISEETEPYLWEKAIYARADVIDKLTEHNDDLANIVIQSDSIDNIHTKDILPALRKVTLEQKAIPVLCGSAYKNIGIQPLMDAVILYLPSPNERSQHYNAFEENLCARAFKIKHDRQKGALTFFRIYSGEFKKGQRIYNIQRECTEHSGKLFIAYADDFQEIDSLSNGNIAVVSGLKQTVAGDLVTNSSVTAQKAKKKMLKLSWNEKKESNIEDESIITLFGGSALIPEPVFFCSIEPPSLAYQAKLDQALTELQREDPSLRVTYDNETGQTVLAGMGELHLEIIKDRIFKEYRIEADLGPLQIAYREAPVHKVTGNLATEHKVGNSKHSVNVELSVIPKSKEDIKDVLLLDKTSEAASNLASIFPKHLLAIKQGVDVGLTHGPKIGLQVVNVQIMLHKVEIGRGTSETMIAAAATQCVHKLLIQSETVILEPVMSLEVVIPEEYLSVVLADLSRRRVIIEKVSVRGNSKVVNCSTPLSELMGYSTTIRTITSGTATFTMEFLQYQGMSSVDEYKAIESIRGF